MWWEEGGLRSSIRILRSMLWCDDRAGTFLSPCIPSTNTKQLSSSGINEICPASRILIALGSDPLSRLCVYEHVHTTCNKQQKPYKNHIPWVLLHRNQHPHVRNCKSIFVLNPQQSNQSKGCWLYVGSGYCTRKKAVGCQEIYQIYSVSREEGDYGTMSPSASSKEQRRLVQCSRRDNEWYQKTLMKPNRNLLATILR